MQTGCVLALNALSHEDRGVGYYLAGTASPSREGPSQKFLRTCRQGTFVLL